MAYATTDQVKAALRLPAPDAQQVDQIDRAVDAASKAIDRYCRRPFNVTASETRIYARTSQTLILTDDLATAPTLVESRASVVSSWETVDATTYQLEPLNQLADGVYWPYTRIRRLSALTWPCADDASALVRVTGTFGWTSVPEEVVEACVLAAVRIIKRPDAPFGVTFGELGAVSVQKGLDPDVAQMLEPYRKIGSN